MSLNALYGELLFAPVEASSEPPVETPIMGHILAWDGSSYSRTNPGEVSRAPDKHDWDELTKKMLVIPKPTRFDAGSNVETRYSAPMVIRHLITPAISIDMVDSGVNGAHGSFKIWDTGTVDPVLIGPVSVTFTIGKTGTITDTAVGVWSIGTAATATDNATLTTTEANIFASTAFTLSGGTVVTGSVGDATHKRVFGPDVYLNFAIPDGTGAGTGTITVQGRISYLFAEFLED